jgi:hypothetical protein
MVVCLGGSVVPLTGGRTTQQIFLKLGVPKTLGKRGY